VKKQSKIQTFSYHARQVSLPHYAARSGQTVTVGRQEFDPPMHQVTFADGFEGHAHADELNGPNPTSR
jgi:hypothetical protein